MNKATQAIWDAGSSSTSDEMNKTIISINKLRAK
jgi:hypothetical protein